MFHLTGTSTSRSRTPTSRSPRSKNWAGAGSPRAGSHRWPSIVVGPLLVFKSPTGPRVSAAGDRTGGIMTKRLVILGVLSLSILVALPAWAISNGVPDEGEHPQVGQLFFYVPDAVDSRFNDPGSWFNCSGTLLTPTLVLTAGHCAVGVGADGASTTTGGGSGNGGNDVWLSFNEVPDYDGVPLSANYDRDENDQRYLDRVAWLIGNDDWARGTAHHHPEYDDNAF